MAIADMECDIKKIFVCFVARNMKEQPAALDLTDLCALPPSASQSEQHSCRCLRKR